jgi:hypothetical protein
MAPHFARARTKTTTAANGTKVTRLVAGPGGVWIFNHNRHLEAS